MKKQFAVCLAALCLCFTGCSRASSQNSPQGGNMTSAAVLASQESVPQLSSVTLNVKGTVIGREGANLCKEPSMFGKEICVLEDHTEVTVISVVDAFQSVIREEGAWLYVSAKGKKGYLCAKYVDIALTDEKKKFDNDQWYVLGAIFLQQHCFDAQNIRKPRALGIDFDREQISRMDAQGNAKYFNHIYRPESLTAEQLSAAYYDEFSKQYYDGTFEELYVTEQGRVFGLLETANGMWTDHFAVTALTTATDNELFYTAREYFVADMQAELGEYQEYLYSLVYEDGRWKCGRFEQTADTAPQK